MNPYRLSQSSDCEQFSRERRSSRGDPWGLLDIEIDVLSFFEDRVVNVLHVEENALVRILSRIDILLRVNAEES